ncbi:MAG: BON domain-containing protein [Candidatus Symbiodolus clandestinus]
MNTRKYLFWTLLMLNLGVVINDALAVPLVSARKPSSMLTTTAEYVNDAAITAQVKNRLNEDKNTKDFSISVKTSEGCVELNGTVPSVSQSNYITKQISRIKGVRSVKNCLVITGKPLSTRGQEQSQSLSEYGSDAMITTKVKAKLIADNRLSAFEITVETSKGEVTLTGFVNTWEQTKIAEDLVLTIKNVKRVNNRLCLKK